MKNNKDYDGTFITLAILIDVGIALICAIMETSIITFLITAAIFTVFCLFIGYIFNHK